MIYIVGLGPGNLELLAEKGKRVIQDCDVLVGGKRNLESLKSLFNLEDFNALETLEIGNNLKEILAFIKMHQDKKKIVVVASGDPMLYGIGKYLSEQLDTGTFEIISGISAISYMCSQIPLNMNDLYITSSHGKIPDFHFILMHNKVAMVTDQKIGPFEIAQEIIKAGMADEKVMWIGENLSYDNQRITKVKPHQVLETSSYEMNVVVIADEK